tara:strand:+ start:2622 stop:3059 length:438 start_codon:yes stop_codon:yes gene_type:complete
MELVSKNLFLIPLIPFLNAILILSLLLSFNRTINRLTKPISVMFILSALASGIIGFIFLIQNRIEDVTFNSIAFYNLNSDIHFHLNRESELLIVVLGLVVAFVVTISMIKLKRQIGYIRYLIFLGSFLSLSLTYVLIAEYPSFLS